MKTAISLPDALFADVERLAKKLKKSRSELVQDALRMFVDRHSGPSLTEQYNAIAADDDSDDVRLFIQSSARNILKSEKW